MISAYESGHRQPALSTFASLVEATGHELELRVRRRPTGLPKLAGPLGKRVRRARGGAVDVPSVSVRRRIPNEDDHSRVVRTGYLPTSSRTWIVVTRARTRLGTLRLDVQPSAVGPS